MFKDLTKKHETTIPAVPIMTACDFTKSIVTVRHPLVYMVKSFFISICLQLSGCPDDVVLQHDSGILSFQSYGEKNIS